MEYSKELTAIQMWLKSTAGLNSFKRGTSVNLSRPVVLFDVPGRGRARHLTRFAYVQTVTWPCTLYVDTLDEAVRYQEAEDAEDANSVKNEDTIIPFQEGRKLKSAACKIK